MSDTGTDWTEPNTPDPDSGYIAPGWFTPNGRALRACLNTNCGRAISARRCADCPHAAFRRQQETRRARP